VRKDSDEPFSKWIPRFTSLRARLLLLLFLILLPVYSFILYAALEARQQAADNARRDALTLMRLVALEQKNFIEITRQQLLTLAQLPIVRRPEWTALCSRTFADLLKQHPLYTNFGVISPDGTQRCSGVPMASRVNLSDRRYFSEAMATRAFVIGDYQIGRVTGKTAVNLAYPVLDAAGHPQAVVFIALDLGALSGRLLATTSLPEGSTLTIRDSHGTILARQPDPEKWIGKPLPDAPLTRSILNHDKAGSVEEIGVDGVMRLYVFEPLHATPTQQVYISAGIPTTAIYADANALLFRALLLMTLVTAAVIALAWFGSRTLVLRPVTALMDATRRLGQGDLGARTDQPHTPDEFGQLAHSLDDMADALQARQTEAARAEARFANIVNLAADAIISVDEEQRILIFNYGAELIFGYTAAEMLGQPLDRLLPERYAEAHRGHIRQFGTAPQTARHMSKRPDIFGRRKDGSEFFAEARISWVMENGKQVFTVFLRDISARKQAEEKMQQQLDELSAVYQLSNAVSGAEAIEEVYEAAKRSILRALEADRVSILLFDTGGVMRFQSWQGLSDTYRKLADGHSPWTPDAVDPEPILVDDIMLDADWAHFSPVTSAEGIRAFGFIPLVQRGRLLGKFMIYFNQPHHFTESEIQLAKTIAFHIAFAIERKQAEEDIRQLNVNLERRVLERTAELAAANQELEAFSYSVSHDLRAPLRSIDGFSQAVLEDYADKLDDQGKDYLNRVRGATQRMGHLIDDMLTLSRVTRAEMRRETVDLSALAADVFAELQKSEPERKVDWHIESGLAAEGDARLLRVVLVNLLGNAWKFTGKTASAKIEFGVTSVPDTGNAPIADTQNAPDTQCAPHVAPSFFVRDNGAGYDMSYADKLFGAFQRLHLVSDFPGTGIGLATVQRTVYRHGGRVWAEGAVGKGATFYFTL